MNILVTGSDGQLGSELRVLANSDTKNTFFFTEVTDLDITKEQEVKAFFDKNTIHFCINCAAYTAVDKAEEERELADLVNVTGPKNLSMACKSAGATLIHISTDFVFNGNASRPISESEDTDPVSYYGKSKLKGEEAIAQTLETYFILRTSWMYSSFGNNFVKTMLHLAETRDELRIISDQIGTPTYARDLAKVIMQLIAVNSNFGIYHYSNEGVASWYDFTSAIFEYAYIQKKVHPIKTEEYPTPARRPHYSLLDKSKIRSIFHLEIPHWRDSLKECLKEL